MPRNFTLAQSTFTSLRAQTWLDLCPATRPQAQGHAQDDVLKARVNRIKNSLAFIKWKIEIRRQLLAVMEANGKYCVICSRSQAVPYCSATCPLLRPDRAWYKQDRAWVYFAAKDVALFDKLENDVSKHEGEADMQIIREWEVTAEDLISRTQDSPPRYGFVMTRHKFRGFNKDWTFKSHWGKGHGIEGEIAPDEILPNEDGHSNEPPSNLKGKLDIETKSTFDSLFDLLTSR